jgi:preprotein translocase subunit SecA
VVEERSRSVTLTEQGVHRVEELVNVPNLYDMEHIETVHHLNQALRAHAVYRRDVDYVVTGGEVVIVDEFTGRLMDGRRWSDGLHQAVEAKEGVSIQRENHTLATITFQNYFRMYEKLSGMTGTAETEREEFLSVYGMDVVIVPTNRPIARFDEPDLIYLSERAKFEAICDDIERRKKLGQPVLVGTASVERSEVLSRYLARRSLEHTVLNAKQHTKESQIVAQAGRLGAVTIATNMAGRGTDILLGGNPEFLARECVIKARNQDATGETFKWMSGRPELIDAKAVAEADYPEERDQNLHDQALEFIQGLVAEYAVELTKAESEMAGDKEQVLAAGGLHILGSERHESRRIDNQLRGRSGRQGDPGSSQFFLSLEDDLMRRFAGEKLQGMMERWGGMKPDDVIDSRLVSKQIEGAQKRVEAYNFGIRKNVLEMDNVMNQQRTTLYAFRREILAGEGFKKRVGDGMERIVVGLVARFCPLAVPSSDWAFESLEAETFKLFDLPVSTGGIRRGDVPDNEAYQMELGNHVYSAVTRQNDRRRIEFGDETYDQLAQTFYLRSIDHHWKAHLTQMDHLKEGIYLRGYGQKDPRHEYRREGFTLFIAMLENVTRDALTQLFRVSLVDEESVARQEAERRARARTMMEDQRRASLGSAQRGTRRARKQAAFTGRVAGGSEEGTVRRDQPKVGRNAPCPCGSGKKYKQCHGRPGVQPVEG